MSQPDNTIYIFNFKIIFFSITITFLFINTHYERKPLNLLHNLIFIKTKCGNDNAMQILYY